MLTVKKPWRTIRRIVLSVLFLSGLAGISFAQVPAKPELKAQYQKAEDFLSVENFNDALPIYLHLDSLIPDNIEYKYKCGICYLYSKHQKANAFFYLDLVNKQFSPEIKNKYVDFEIYYFLGRALHLSYRFDDAISYFERYKKFLKKDDPRLAESDREIEICRFAKIEMEKNSYMKIVNLGPVINSSYPEYGPVITADESELVFTSRRPGSTGGKRNEKGEYFEDIYVSHQANGEWIIPVGIDTAINTNIHEAAVSLSIDGDQLIIYKDDNQDGNLYTCTLKGERWSSPQKLNANINSKSWEPSATLSSDRTSLYFVSDRLGKNRGRDIFVSHLLPDGTWGPSKNLGNKINTEYDEEAPFIHPNGRTLYFSSKGHNSIGGFDIFRSTLDDYGEWSEPVNLGYPLNTTDDDIFFVLSADGKHGYFSSDRAGGYGDEDIYRCDFIESSELPLVVLKGKVIHKNDTLSFVNATITVTEQSTGDIIGYYKPNNKTGTFLVVLPTDKNFDVTVEESGYKSYEDMLILEQQHRYIEVEKNIVLEKEISSDTIPKKAVAKMDVQFAKPGDKIILHSVQFDFDKATLKNEYQKDLDMISTMLTENPGLIVEISSHTDSKGTPEYNLKLSKERSANVIAYLVARGIPEKQMIGKGYGDTRPIAGNTNPDGTDNPEGRQTNRRTEFKILNIENR